MGRKFKNAFPQSLMNDNALSYLHEFGIHPRSLKEIDGSTVPPASKSSLGGGLGIAAPTCGCGS